MLGVGLMAGTSLDGVDAALVRFGEGEADAELVAFRSTPYTPALRERLLECLRHGSTREVALLHVALGERYADAVADLLSAADVDPAEVAFVASHGQTVWHEPGRATVQLGDPAVIAERVGIRVISDFRSRDVAAGGQGAPLVPLVDVLLFGAETHPRTLVNIGGIANATWVPRRGRFEGVIAFDTGPGVAVLDAVVRRVAPGETMDRDGARAARGTPVVELVEALAADPYFATPPPKSTGRERFGEAVADRIVAAAGTPEAATATALAFTVRSLADQLTRWLPPHGDVVLSGGGTRNPTLVDRLRAALPDRTVHLFDELFFDGDAKEAVAFAVLGRRTLLGQPGNVPGATGARGPRVLGRITPL